MIDAALRSFIDDVTVVVDAGGDEQNTVTLVAERLERLLESSFELPPAFLRPLADKYAMYPIHVSPNGSFSVAIAVWGVGQETPIHDHLVWGVVGIVSGVERELRYRMPPDGPPQLVAESNFAAGDVVVCCTTDDDVHAVACAGDSTVVAIHVYGGDIGTAARHSYDPATGKAKSFTSAWCAPPSAARE